MESSFRWGSFSVKYISAIAALKFKVIFNLDNTVSGHLAGLAVKEILSVS